MNQDERRKYILDQLKIKSSISVSELSEAFSLSEVSVRKLLANMEQEGVLKRTWGGAVSRYGSLREFSHQENEVRHREEKKAIAAAAYDCIQDGEAVFLDSGTTTFELARMIVEGPKRKILTISKEKIMLLDYTKFGDDSMVLIARPEDVDVLITDWHAPDELVAGFGDKGVKTIMAPQV